MSKKDNDIEDAIEVLKAIAALDNYFTEHTNNKAESYEAEKQKKQIIQLLDAYAESKKNYEELQEQIIKFANIKEIEVKEIKK